MAEVKAKHASMISKACALIWIIVGETLVGLQVFKGIDWIQVIIIGLVLAVVFITTDISLILKNVSAGKIDLTGAMPKDDK